ncbi:YdcF family protein [Nocardia sp. NPDC048505]|uniref:YdcF family protein n=1 Tax=unclassified Nocardia TaxID=2637762 RepID=UPI0033E52467
MILLLIGLVLLGVFALRFRGDRRRLGNGVFLLLGLICVGLWLVHADGDSLLPILAGLLLLLSPLLVLVLAGLLIVNGVQLIRREHRMRPANMLSLGLGVALLAPYVLFVAALLTENTWVVIATAMVTLAICYAGLLLVAFVLYSFVYGRLRYRPGMDAIVVHGAGLNGTQVTPLLAGRLDRALEVYRAEVAQGRRPLLVPSGGQGADEVVSEAAAMSDYLVRRGVPAAAIRLEDRSTNTRENLLYSAELVGPQVRMLLVTSNFHILRTAVLARRLGLDAEVTGSPTAFYYLPNAILREFIGALYTHRWIHLAACLAFASLPLLALLLDRALPSDGVI